MKKHVSLFFVELFTEVSSPPVKTTEKRSKSVLFDSENSSDDNDDSLFNDAPKVKKGKVARNLYN